MSTCLHFNDANFLIENVYTFLGNKGKIANSMRKINQK